MESLIDRLESVGKFVENILQFVSDHKDELIGAAKNLRVTFLSWCRKLQEIKLRHSPNCTFQTYRAQLKELAGRTIKEINENTLLHLRALGFTKVERYCRSSSCLALDSMEKRTRTWYRREK